MKPFIIMKHDFITIYNFIDIKNRLDKFKTNLYLIYIHKKYNHPPTSL
jgi:hypothetical protein